MCFYICAFINGKNTMDTSSDKENNSPQWIQNDETPCCCKKKMKFYSQSENKKIDKEIGERSRVYTFICPICLDVKSIVQFY